MADGAVRWPFASVTPCAAQQSWPTSASVSGRSAMPRTERRVASACSTDIAPSVRGEGRVTADAAEATRTLRTTRMRWLGTANLQAVG